MEQTKRTYCRICEAHCGLQVDFDEMGNIKKIRPDSEHPISQGFICAKGLKFLNIADHPERILQPQIRQNDGSLKSASWDEALKYFEDKIRPIIAQHGVHSVAIYFGTPMIHNTLGSLTLFRWIRALGTRNVFSAASQDNSNKFTAQKIIHNSCWVMPISDIEHADFMLLMGTDPVVSQGTFVHMPHGTKAYDNFIKRGGEMVIVDPRKSESAKRWGGHLRIILGTDIYLLLAILNELRDLYKADEPHGLDKLLEIAKLYPAEVASEITGIDADEIRNLAQKIRQAKHATFISAVGINQGAFGTLCVIALQAIAYLTGNFDAKGGLLFNPWAHILEWLIGTPAQHSRIGNYKSHIGGMPCGILGDEILTEGDGQIKALIVVAGNPLTSAPDENKLRKAFKNLDFLVSIDIFENQTGKLADTILPGTSWLERYDLAAWDAMYENEPMLQSTPPTRKTPNETRQEWKIITQLSIASGKPVFGFNLLAKLWGSIYWDKVLPILTKPIQWLFRGRLQGTDALPWYQPKAGIYSGKNKQKLRFWDDGLDNEVSRLNTFSQSVLQDDTHTLLLMGRRRRLAQNSWIHNASAKKRKKKLTHG